MKGVPPQHLICGLDDKTKEIGLPGTENQRINILTVVCHLISFCHEVAIEWFTRVAY